MGKRSCPPNIRDLSSDHSLLLLVSEVQTKNCVTTVVVPPPVFASPLFLLTKVTSRGFKGTLFPHLHYFPSSGRQTLMTRAFKRNYIYGGNYKVTVHAQGKVKFQNTAEKTINL